jgi:hypothetical protein
MPTFIVEACIPVRLTGYSKYVVKVTAESQQEAKQRISQRGFSSEEVHRAEWIDDLELETDEVYWSDVDVKSITFYSDTDADV